MVTETLNEGALALFPQKLNKSFVEQGTSIAELEAWLEVLLTAHPNIKSLGEAVAPWLRLALAGEERPDFDTCLEKWDGQANSLEALGARWFEPHMAIDPTPSATLGLLNEGVTQPDMLDFEGVDDELWDEFGEMYDGDLELIE